jgi:cytochrome b561
MNDAAAAYTRPQVLLHWLIVVLVAAQFLTADAMEDFFDKAEDAGALAGFPAGDAGAMAHALGGSTILVLMLIRFGLRLAHGAPPPPASLSPMLQFAARATHYIFYVLLIALPLTGATALYVNSEAGDVHGLLKTVLLLFILAHVAGALTHAFVFRDGVVRRMLSWN